MQDDLLNHILISDKNTKALACLTDDNKSVHEQSIKIKNKDNDLYCFHKTESPQSNPFLLPRKTVIHAYYLELLKILSRKTKTNFF